MKNFNFDNITVGIDVVEVSRFVAFDQKSRLAKNIFTAKEIKECAKKKNPAESLATRFAAKEALQKTIKEKIKFNEVEIQNDANGAPYIRFLNKKVNAKYTSMISMSHTASVAQAICLTYKNHG